MKNGLSFRNLEVEISGRRILTNLNLEVKAGEFIVLLGKSGSGKTTLLRALARELKLKTGTLESPIDIGLAQQSAPLFPWLSVLENLTLASGAERSTARLRALELLERVQMADAASLRPHQLSGGMRSRVVLIRAFMCSPSLVLMDEPFNGLDIQTREDLQAMTIELWREVGSTVVLVSHDLDEAIRMGDRLLVLSHCGDGFIMDEINHIERPRPRRSIDIQQNSEFRRLWMQVQSVIS